MVFSGWSFLQLGLEAAQQISVDTGIDFLAENLLGAFDGQSCNLLTQGFAGLDSLLLSFSFCSGDDLVAFFGGTCFGFVNDAICTALGVSQARSRLAAADKAKAELSNANARVESELAKSRNETASRLADAERRANGIVDEAKARATEEGNKIIVAAKAEAEQQSVKAREALREQVAALAVKGAEQILRKEVNAGVHADLLSRLKTEL